LKRGEFVGNPAQEGTSQNHEASQLRETLAEEVNHELAVETNARSSGSELPRASKETTQEVLCRDLTRKPAKPRSQAYMTNVVGEAVQEKPVPGQSSHSRRKPQGPRLCNCGRVLGYAIRRAADPKTANDCLPNGKRHVEVSACRN
jgi:CCR4-NOT transcriptional regulation complex NOT5 subunit